MPAIIGLTGGIASGKSTVSRFFRELGAHVIDADVIAREVVARGSEGLKEIQQAFGDEVIGEDGELDRARLGEIVFGDEGARRKLNAITHPGIARLMWQRATEAEALHGHAWVIYDAALIVENNIQSMLQGLVVVSCTQDAQLERLMTRDGFSQEVARARIASQLPLEDKVAVADHVIDNSGTPEHTRAQTQTLFTLLHNQFTQEIAP